MPLDLARRIGVALDVRSETRIRQIDRALKEYVRLTPQSPTVPSAGNIDASQIISGLVPDARISESSVTQHEAALEIDWLQLTGVPATFPPSAHNHNASDVNAGTFADARIAQSNVTQHQAALILAATQLTSGVLADARVQQSNVTQHEAALDIDWLQLTGVPSVFPPDDHLLTGTWTPTDASAGGLSLVNVASTYMKHEGLVIAQTRMAYPVNADGNTSLVGGLPFTVANSAAARQGFISLATSATLRYALPALNATTFTLFDSSGNALTNAQMSGVAFFATFIYPEEP